ncbi:alpha/beta fold hydrolase [Phaeobacter sp. B1627]|uniref:alpha/beta fold hydrolase n=1 Tax=Phaeobacter sp. B1627 TaxID=2583809 RepID=UPI00111ACFCE|nr:alpha/beta hydrolase [Phaeobacter sp. B1627]TNJ40612.1 alpha/beta hydrolase [Phaeobacter sp. B1627]
MTLTTLRLSKSGNSVALRDQGAGAPVVLIHGVGMQSAAWGPQIEALSRTHRVIAVDMPGHGGSSPLSPGSDLRAFVAWCHEVVLALGLGPVSIAGHSMGALIAGGFAVDHPQLTTRVCLINGVFRRDAAARDAVIDRADQIQVGRFDPQAPLARWFGNSASEIAARDQVAQWLSEVDPEGYATAYGAFARGDMTYASQYSQIQCPFVALTGSDDPNSTPAMSRAMAAAASDGQAIIVEGHRHMMTLTAPTITNTHLIAWLTRPNPMRELP